MAVQSTTQRIAGHLQNPAVTELFSDLGFTHINIPMQEHHRLVGDAQGMFYSSGYEPTPSPTPDLDGTLIGASLSQNTTLRVLSMVQNRFPAGIESIAQALHSNTTLRTLALPITEAGDDLHIRTLLETNQTLTSLTLAGERLERGVGEILTGLRKNQSVSSLVLPIRGDEEMTVLGLVLKQNSSLTSLSLKTRNVTLAGVSSLFQNLMRNTTLSTLKLSHIQSRFVESRIKDAEVKAWIPFLIHNSSLTDFGLKEDAERGVYRRDEHGEKDIQAVLDRNIFNDQQRALSLLELLLPKLNDTEESTV